MTKLVPHPSRMGYFLGMVVYYQQFIERCSVIAKPLFQLTAGSKGQRRKKGKENVLKRTLTAEDWTDDGRQAFCCLKQALIDCFIGSSGF